MFMIAKWKNFTPGSSALCLLVSIATATKCQSTAHKNPRLASITFYTHRHAGELVSHDALWVLKRNGVWTRRRLCVVEMHIRRMYAVWRRGNAEANCVCGNHIWIFLGWSSWWESGTMCRFWNEQFGFNVWWWSSNIVGNKWEIVSFLLLQVFFRLFHYSYTNSLWFFFQTLCIMD